MDFNTIISAALTQAIEQVTGPLLARISELETLVGRLTAQVESANDGLAKLELAHSLDENNNPTHTELNDRLTAVENKLGMWSGPDAKRLNENGTWQETVDKRLVEISWVLTHIFDDSSIGSLAEAIQKGNQLELTSYMKALVTEIADEAAEKEMRSHCHEYDHGDFVSTSGEIIGALDIDDLIEEINNSGGVNTDEETIRRQVNRVMEDATISISV